MKSRGMAYARPLMLRYQDLSPGSLQMDLEFIDQVVKLVFIDE